jgi:hypothetical protein
MRLESSLYFAVRNAARLIWEFGDMLKQQYLSNIELAYRNQGIKESVKEGYCVKQVSRKAKWLTPD